MTQKELGTNVQLERQVDESIVDGLLLKFGNYELDLTARTFLVKEIDAQLNAILEEYVFFIIIYCLLLNRLVFVCLFVVCHRWNRNCNAFK